ncbi:unnamed protein product [Gongylonema pulchrum]|uniref:ABC transmembrane type-1 domain-containing protein n=1 Tax=Gongylonema pulchrum TaxID=637853 RepID=A0A183DFB9_9BILA|nr:unnamed protein product [Gongylonema pulchrum]
MITSPRTPGARTLSFGQWARAAKARALTFEAVRLLKRRRGAVVSAVAMVGQLFSAAMMLVVWVAAAAAVGASVLV